MMEVGTLLTNCFTGDRDTDRVGWASRSLGP